ASLYHAVSYTWGDASEQELITILSGTEQRGMIIRKNCADVLRQLAYFKTSKYYWIDAICINQSDNPEKEVQVASMGQIFSRADRVLACLG
ncbi:heterokaryon incompatibility, partial [Setomelanomma holmii]